MELDDSIKHSVEDTETLASFLSTFQQSLLSTSSQISSLQTKSTEIDDQLRKQKAQAKEIDELLKELIISPQLINLIMNKELTDVDAWIEGCKSIEGLLRSVEKHQHVKARVQLQSVLQALKVKVRRGIFRRGLAHNIYRLQTRYAVGFSACLRPSRPQQHPTSHSTKQQCCSSTHPCTHFSRDRSHRLLKKLSVSMPILHEAITRPA